MRKYILVSVIAIIAFFVGNALGSSTPHLDQYVQNSITPWMLKNKIPGLAVELYVDGVPHSYYFGVANRDKKNPVTSKTIFEVGSFTKLFTSVLLAEQVNKKAISLNENIDHYLSDLVVANEAFHNITFENLATHTTGFPFSLPEGIKTRSELKTYLHTWHPKQPIGEEWIYSNVNMGLLGFALETVTHRNINQLYREHILTPLGMDPIGTIVPKKYLKNYAQGYDEKGNPIFEDSKEWLFPSAGAMKISGKDMQLFLKAAIGLPGVPEEVVKAIRTTEIAYVQLADMKQGLGWVIHTHISANRQTLLNPPTATILGPLAARQLPKHDQQFYREALIEKTGATKGFRSYIGVVPAKRSGIVILTNRYVSNGEILKIGRGILLNLNR